VQKGQGRKKKRKIRRIRGKCHNPLGRPQRNNVEKAEEKKGEGRGKRTEKPRREETMHGPAEMNKKKELRNVKEEDRNKKEKGMNNQNQKVKKKDKTPRKEGGLTQITTSQARTTEKGRRRGKGKRKTGRLPQPISGQSDLRKNKKR